MKKYKILWDKTITVGESTHFRQAKKLAKKLQKEMKYNTVQVARLDRPATFICGIMKDPAKYTLLWESPEYKEVVL